jgi:hypothetical protein
MPNEPNTAPTATTGTEKPELWLEPEWISAFFWEFLCDVCSKVRNNAAFVSRSWDLEFSWLGRNAGRNIQNCRDLG